MYTHKTVVRLQHVDAAGVIYFSNIFVLAHDCYETFLDGVMPLGKILEQGQYIAPIVHAEADIARPIRLSDALEVRMKLKETGRSSFCLTYEFADKDSQTVATAETVHVILKADTRQPVKIPAHFMEVLRTI